MVAASVAGAVCVNGLATTHAHAASPRAEIRGLNDKTLRQEIAAAIGEAPSPVSRLEARRRAQEAADTATAVLRSEGYYDATVEPDIGEGDAPQPFVVVTPGPRTQIVDPGIDWVEGAPDKAAQDVAMQALGLKPGQPARAVEIIAAEGRAVAALQNQGYADAAARIREVVVDHADHSMRPRFRIASGSEVRLGEVKLEKRGRTRLRWLAHLTPWKRGDRYRPAKVAELERRLLDTGVYDSVTVALAPADEAVGGLRPVIVNLADRPKGVLELGASYSTTEGAGVNSSWTVYNRFGRADTLTTTVQFAQIDSRLQTELALPHWRKPEETLKLTGAIYRDHTSAYDVVGAGLAADLTHRYGKTSFLTYGASFDETQTTEREAAEFIRGGRLRVLSTFGLLAAFSADRSNDPLNPTTGFRLSGRLEPKDNVGDGSIAYVKTSAQASVYWPVLGSDATVIAARVRIGSILGGSIPRVPAPDRFYAGGGGSVRGFAYQAVGPRYPDNTPTGGLSLFESAFEVRQRLTQRWGAVAFIDAGSVGEQIAPNFQRPDIGVGVGLRYNLGFGPIRVDFATPLTARRGDSPFQIYLSVGQSF